MDEREIEDMIRSFEGPQPSPETTRRILQAARPAREVRQPGSASRIAVLKNTSRSGRWVYALCAACFCAAAALWLFRTSTPEAVATLLSDEARVQRGGAALTLLRNESVLAGDRILTTALTRCRMLDNSDVKIDKGASIVFERPGGSERAHLHLESGRVLLRVSKSPGDFIVAGSAAVRVVGTCFGVDEKEGRTSVSVLEGVVALKTTGDELKLTRGQSGAASAATVPELTPGDPNAALLWARETVRFDERPLGEVLSWIAANSSYRFDTTQFKSQHLVTVAVGEEPIRQVIEALLLSCNLDYTIQDQIVTVREP